MRIQINITQEVLERTKFCSDRAGENCAISYAVREIFPDAWVSPNVINTDGAKGLAKRMMHKQNLLLSEMCCADMIEDENVIPLPGLARQFISVFDKATPGQRVQLKPFSFEIDVPSEVIDHIGIGQVYKILSESKTLYYVGPKNPYIVQYNQLGKAIMIPGFYHKS